MHVLFALQQQGYNFELKGGTSLSKGFGIIDRFSEDIDIHIHPPSALNVAIGPRQIKPKQIASRRSFYDQLSHALTLEGILAVTRDTAFDDERYYRSGGIRLSYESLFTNVLGVKEGVLLELGFDTVTPNIPLTISSWAYERAKAVLGPEIIDNRAVDVYCYHPGFTFVEKLQTIVTKFRLEEERGVASPNLLRQYYDVYCLLGAEDVRAFIGTDDYKQHILDRFPKIDLERPIQENEAFRLTNQDKREDLIQRYKKTASLYYKGQPDFEVILQRIQENLDRL